MPQKHYAFAVQAFLDIVDECAGKDFELTLRETTTRQVIDDVAHKTIVGASTLGPEFKATGKKSSTVEGASAIGEIIGKKAIEAGITEVVFDRGGHLYHGRVKAVAEAAREAGLKF